MEIGDRGKEAGCYANLGATFHFLCEHMKATEYLENALAIFMEIGDRARVATISSRFAVV